jgi:transcriptional regulator with XRE-family HTH domain
MELPLAKIYRDGIKAGMKLDQFLAEKDMSRAEFAKAIGVSEVSVTRYIGRTRIPQPAVMARINDVTNGQVTPNDFLLAVDAPPAPIAANEGAPAQ